jgi:hypothetical protein
MHDWRHMLTYHLSLGKLTPREVLELVMSEFNDYIESQRSRPLTEKELEALDEEARVATHAFNEFARDNNLEATRPVPRGKWINPL